jgi:PAS domain S-box-containing protein
MLLALIQNISLIVSIAVLYQFITRNLHRRPIEASIVSGLLFGTASVIAMSAPFRFASGIIYDGRTIIMAVAGLFGGPVVALLAAGIGSIYRFFWIGGSGAVAGVSTIIFSTAGGIFFYIWRNKTKTSLTVPRLIFIGLVIHISMLLSQFLLPDRRWAEVLPIISLPVLFVYPLGFTLICAIFIDSEERIKNQKKVEESEARYTLLFHNQHTCMLLVDAESGKILDANPAAASFYGYSREELLLKKASDINTLSPEEIAKEMENALTRASSLYYFRHRLASGELRDVEVFTGPIEFMGKKVLYSIIHDATLRLKAEQEVRELNQSLEQRVATRTLELEEANHELQAFSYSVSHDLRAPLRSIEGFSSLLAEEALPSLGESSRHYLERIQYNAKKMSSLIEELLKLSRINRQELVTSQVDLSRLARETCAELGSQDPKRNVDIQIQEGIVAEADPMLIDALLKNLFMNAWKFTIPVSDARIEFFCLDNEGETAYCVRDNGIGFDMQYADKLFVPFQRLHGEKEFGGSGIGLSIVRRIASRHGGRTWAISEPDRGASFYFTLGGLP